MSAEFLLEARGASMQDPGTLALDNVTFRLHVAASDAAPPLRDVMPILLKMETAP